MTARQLVLWRHGRTASNAGGRFQGQLDVPLDEVGEVQVKDAAELLAAEVGGAPALRLVSSDLSRARLTATALADRLGLEITFDRRLREVSVGRWEGLLHDEVRSMDPEGFAAWRSGDDVAAGGGERKSEAGARAAEAIVEYAATVPDDGVLVVAGHGAALRAAILRMVGAGPWQAGLLGPFANAHWARLDARRDGWVLGAYNVGPPRAIAPVEG